MRSNYMLLTSLVFAFLMFNYSALAGDSSEYDLLGIKIGEDVSSSLDKLKSRNSETYITELNKTKIIDHHIKYESEPIHVGYKVTNFDYTLRKRRSKPPVHEETVLILQDLHRSRNSKVLGVSRKLYWKHGHLGTEKVRYEDVKTALIKKYGEPDHSWFLKSSKDKMESGCYLMWGGPLDNILKGNPKGVIDRSASVIKTITTAGAVGYLNQRKIYTNKPFVGCGLSRQNTNPEMITLMTCVMLDPAKLTESIDDFTSFVESEKSKSKKILSEKASSNKLDY